ncbi:hypothetical protein POTOM_060845 [Populus tomentosa]|uniref:Uncharacterized protein n=1 Tax=Populus tomentosa TaxID=118781 RepID=A0A8X7XU38_POPTO|nr:hypothetical protein POTOM_060845 [Populus tomentosa]
MASPPLLTPTIVDLGGWFHIGWFHKNFPRNNASFAYCIGELITLLKNQSVISVATIAPFHSTTVLPYIELFIKYGDVIDNVNHQFYTDKVRSPKGYLAAFQLRATQFDMDKLLPSYAVNGRGIQGDAFSDALICWRQILDLMSME